VTEHILVDAKELKLKANHNTATSGMAASVDAKELKLKANHNKQTCTEN